MISDKEQSALGKTIQVGIGQLGNPTPVWMKYTMRTVLYVSMAWAFLAPTFTTIPDTVLAEINMWLLRANGLLSLTIKFFGWDYKTD